MVEAIGNIRSRDEVLARTTNTVASRKLASTPLGITFGMPGVNSGGQ